MTLRPFVRLSARQNAFWLLLGAVVFGLLSGAYVYLDIVASGGHATLARPLLEELTGALGAVLLVPLVVGAVRRWPLFERRSWRHVPLHLLVLLAFGFLATSWMWLSRSLLFPVLGYGPYDYGLMPVRYFMELPKQAIVFVVILVVTTLVDRQDAARRRELRLSQMETALAQAQLSALHAQLQPHFLFNALNTVSSVMYADVGRADRMLTLLSDLLRWSLRASDTREVPLQAELAATRKYLELMHARFGDRLSSTVDVAPDAANAVVPALLLQPLVENAAEHGMPDPPSAAHIEVTVRREHAALIIEVADNGRGYDAARPAVEGRGVGLRNTTARLRALYGELASLELVTRVGGGTRAVIRIPYRRAGSQHAQMEGQWTAFV